MARFNRAAERIKRHKRIRKKVSGTNARPRLCIAKTLRHLYAQIIDDEARVTVLQASTLEPGFRDEHRGANMATAEKLGAVLENLDTGAVYLKADKQVPYGVVVNVMSQIKKAGVESLGMITLPDDADAS